MTTLETIIQKRLDEYRDQYSCLGDIEKQLQKNPRDRNLLEAKQKALKAKDEEIAYLLEVTPFIKQLDDDERETQEDRSDPEECEEEQKPRQTDEGKGIVGFIKVRRVSNRSEVFAEYMRKIEGKYITTGESQYSDRDEYFCECGNARVYVPSSSEYVCEACGRTQYIIEMSARNLTYAEEVAAVSNPSFTYNRLNHLCEWLNSIQAKENTDIPKEVVEAVKAEFRKEGTVTRKDIKPSKVRAFLKKLNLNKYYEHTNYITGLLNGVPPPKFPRELEETFKNMFIAAQAPFDRHCPPGRKNFLSYSYTLYKFCQLLGEDKYLKHFGLLKSTTKLHAQDMMWKKICEDLGWEFIPSV